MSEKVTFGELIESIAEETEHSKQFTHDFLKDFVDVINGGLEEDGKVNIAGFGKFELQRVPEREGYNPQTEEKITIPAHNKVVFKPYKDLRELVNAPYAHMEPQLIEEEETEASDDDPSSASQQEQETESPAEESGVSGDKSSKKEYEPLKQDRKTDPDIPDRSEEQERNEDDFIPTAPPTSHDQNKDDFDGEDHAGAERGSPFDRVEQQEEDENLSQETTSELSDDDDNGDIVEFNAAQSDTEDDLLEEFIGSEEKDDEEPSEELTDTHEGQLASAKNESHETEEESVEPLSGEQDDKEKPTGKSEEEVLAEEVEKLEKAAENLKNDFQSPSDQENEETPPRPAAVTRRPSDRNSSFLYVAAAAIILLLIAGGAWYYSTLPTNDTGTTLISSSEEQTVSADATLQQNNNSEQQPAEEQTKDAQQGTQNQSQSVTQSPATAPSTPNTTPNEQAVKIEKGQTLWSLAEDRYGNPRLWPWIYGNNGSLDDPDLIYAGSSLSVPLPSGPQNTLTDTDSVGVAKGYIATYKWYKSNEEPKAKNHLWAAKLYHDDLQQLADVPIDQTDLSYANRAR